jgi:hypothetical protein
LCASIGMALGGAVTANAADTGETASITLTGEDLKGHSFKFYQLGSYEDPTAGDNANTWASVSVSDIDAATSSWITDAFATAGVKEESGVANAEVLAKLTDATTIRKVADALAASSQLPATAADTAEGAGAAVTTALPNPGMYLVTDTNGYTMIVDSTDGNITTLGKQTLGTAAVKGLATKPDITVEEPDGKWYDHGTATNGLTKNIKVTFNLLSSDVASSMSFGESVTGLTYQSNSMKAEIDGTDVTKDVTEASTATSDNPDNITFTVSNDALKNYAGKTITLSYSVTADGTDTHSVWGAIDATLLSGSKFENTDLSDQAFLTQNSFSVKKVDEKDTTKVLAGAQFTIEDQDTGKWMSWNADSKTWSEADSSDSATPFTTDANGLAVFTNLGAGNYLVQETKAPTGYLNMSLPSFVATVNEDTDDSIPSVSIEGKDAAGLTSQQNTYEKDAKGNVTSTTYIAQVENINSLTELPATGGAGLLMTLLTGALVLGGGAAVTIVAVRKRNSLRINR